MREIILVSEITFLEIAKKSFSFPITNSIRLSFWLTKDKVSTFCEIQKSNKVIELGILEKVEIKLLERDFLVNRIKIGTEFRLGAYPNEIAVGKIVKIKYI